MENPVYPSWVDTRISQYRRRAEELRLIAQGTSAERIADQLRDLAAKYDELAASLEREAGGTSAISSR